METSESKVIDNFILLCNVLCSPSPLLPADFLLPPLLLLRLPVGFLLLQTWSILSLDFQRIYQEEIFFSNFWYVLLTENIWNLFLFVTSDSTDCISAWLLDFCALLQNTQLHLMSRNLNRARKDFEISPTTLVHRVSLARVNGSLNPFAFSYIKNSLHDMM